MASGLFTPLPLRSGQVLRNRIATAAMEENMAGDGQLPGQELLTLYRRWATGGTGLLITGNVSGWVRRKGRQGGPPGRAAPGRRR